jgi:predicted flavoprotein YhiN
VAGEFVITRHGIEGGAVYALAPVLREGATLALDLVPDLPADTIARRLGRPRGKVSLSNHFRKSLGLPAVKLALLREFAPAALADPAAATRALKALPVPLTGPRPIDEAISTAGGVTRAAVDDTLMLRVRPGTFCAGEMLDWDAPTGGYLLTACLATGRWAGKAAADWLETAGAPAGA